VPVADEIELKRFAAGKGLLVMGPDCGTALIGGAPIAFANVVPRGDVGLISASGTGLQEVSCLLARAGRGISHGIGVGGRDLSEEVGGCDDLRRIRSARCRSCHAPYRGHFQTPRQGGLPTWSTARVARSAKPVTLCLLGRRRQWTLASAAEAVLGRPLAGGPLPTVGKRPGWLRGLYSGGTLCNEAQLVLIGAGIEVRSNVPVPGATQTTRLEVDAHSLIDLGDDVIHARGRPLTR